MKKTLILTAFAALALAFTSCGGDDKKLESIAIRPTELTLSPGETARLSIVTTPEKIDQTKFEFVWETNDEEVVTVSKNGSVEAIDLGEATITVTCGDLKASCKVIVKDYLETLNFTGMFVYDYDTTYSNVLDTIHHSSGQDFVTKQVLCNVMVFSEGFYYDNEGMLGGANKGAILEFEAPFRWAPAWANNGSGTIFVLGGWIVNDTVKAGQNMSGIPYSIDAVPFTEGVDSYVQNFLQYRATSEEKYATAASEALKAASENISGATLKVYEFHSTEEGYGQDGYYSSYIPDLMVSNLVVEAGDNYSASDYMLSVDYSNIYAAPLLDDYNEATGVEYVYGVKFNTTETGLSLADNTVTVSKDGYHYSFGAPSKAPEYRVVPVKTLTVEQKENLQKQLNLGTVRRANVK